jgi:hypothetical protein
LQVESGISPLFSMVLRVACISAGSLLFSW